MTDRTVEQLAQALERVAGYCKTDGAPDAPALCRESAARLRDLERKLGKADALIAAYEDGNERPVSELATQFRDKFHDYKERATAAESALALAQKEISALNHHLNCAYEAVGLSTDSSEPLSAAILRVLASARAAERERCLHELCDVRDAMKYNDHDGVSYRDGVTAGILRIEALKDPASGVPSTRLDMSNPDDAMRWALAGLDLCRNGLRNRRRLCDNDVEMHNLQSAIESINQARAALTAAREQGREAWRQMADLDDVPPAYRLLNSRDLDGVYTRWNRVYYSFKLPPLPDAAMQQAGEVPK